MDAAYDIGKDKWNPLYVYRLFYNYIFQRIWQLKAKIVAYNVL